MKRVVLAAFTSGLVGALLGAMLGARAVRHEACLDAGPGVASSDAELARRVDALERALVGAEPRAEVPPAPSPATLTATLAGAELPPPGPILQDTVVDLLGRPAPASGRARAPDLDRSESDRYWAHELTMRLGLTPAQTERLRAIQAELDRELARAEAAPSERRRATRRALQQRAEQQLRAVLAPRQLDAYAGLDARLKLYPGDVN